MKHLLKRIDDDRIRQGLVNAIWDGVLWAIMFGFTESYLIPFALIFGATAFQVSLIQGTAQLGVGIAQLLGARFILKFQKRKKLAIFCSRLHAISWLLVFFITFWLKSPWVILIFYFLGLSSSNFGGPGWLSWMNDLVPQHLRGEYWGIRNKIIGITQFAAIAIAGIVLHFAKEANQEMLAYGILFSLAFVARFANFIPLGRQYEPPMPVAAFTNAFKFRIFLVKLFTTNFGKFALFSILMTFSINFIAPIVPVYVLKFLNFNYLQFTLIIMSPIITSFIFMTYWGRLSDIYGNYRILFTTAMTIPLIPFMWTFLINFSSLILLQAFSGFVFAGFNLATVNFIFDAVRRENISKIMAYFNTLNTMCAFLGAFTGGFAVSVLSNVDFSRFLVLNRFTVVFLISAFLRILIFLGFIRGFKEVRKVQVSPPLHYFYVYKPTINIINRFQIINDRFFKNGNSWNKEKS